jgi:hypothetical protein
LLPRQGIFGKPGKNSLSLKQLAGVSKNTLARPAHNIGLIIMVTEKETKNASPALNPYVFTVLLFLFGIWCGYDGWLNADPEMQKHQLFNRVISAILLPWSAYDFFKVRKSYKKEAAAPEETDRPESP